MLEKLQKEELGILKECLKIMERHHLTYYALGGTLLGAVRHKGFIPWDDDIDIGMPRPDYEKFIRYAEKELKAPFRMRSRNSNDEYFYYYVRVENSDIRLKRTATAKDVMINAWIDVFPLDGAPEDQKEFLKWNRKGKILRKLFEMSQFDYFFSINSSQKTKNQMVVLGKKLISKSKIYKLLNTDKRWKALDNHLKAQTVKKSSRIYNFCGFWETKECFPKDVYGAGREYQFEDIMIHGPEDYDYVLKQMYGDYMTPPKDIDREHHCIEITDDSNLSTLEER